MAETSHVSLELDGFPSSGGYRVKRWLVDATLNNTYGTYVVSGLNAAIASEPLQKLDTLLVTDLSRVLDVDPRGLARRSQRRSRFGTPAASGQCGLTAFAACRTTGGGAAVRCP